MTVRFPGQRRPPGQSPAHLVAAGPSDLAVLAPLTLVGDRGHHLLRVLDGCVPFGSGYDELVSLLADACAPVDPLELRGEGEALAAFRAANGRVRDRLPVAGSGRRVAARRASRRPPRPAAQWSGAGSSGAAPLLGSALAVAASAAVMIFAHAGSLAVDPLDGGQRPAAIRPAVADHPRTRAGAAGGGSVVAEPGRTPSSLPATSPHGSGATGRRGSASPTGADSAAVPAAAGQFAAGQSPSATRPWLPAGSSDGPSESPGSRDGSGSGPSGGPGLEVGPGAGPGMAHGEHPTDPIPGNGQGNGPRAGQNPGQGSARNPGRGQNPGKVVGKNETTAAGTPPVGPVGEPEPAPSAGVAPTTAPSWPFDGSDLDAGTISGMSGVLAPGAVVDTQVPAT